MSTTEEIRIADLDELEDLSEAQVVVDGISYDKLYRGDLGKWKNGILASAETTAGSIANATGLGEGSTAPEDPVEYVYEFNEVSNYLKQSDFTTAGLDGNLKNADTLLDAKIKEVEDSVQDAESTCALDEAVSVEDADVVRTTKCLVAVDYDELYTIPIVSTSSTQGVSLTELQDFVLLTKTFADYTANAMNYIIDCGAETDYFGLSKEFGYFDIGTIMDLDGLTIQGITFAVTENTPESDYTITVANGTRTHTIRLLNYEGGLGNIYETLEYKAPKSTFLNELTGGMTPHVFSVTLETDTAYVIDTDIFGMGKIAVVKDDLTSFTSLDETSFQVNCNSNEVLIDTTGDIANTDTPSKLCLYVEDDTLKLRNRTGGVVTVLFDGKFIKLQTIS